MQDQKQQYRAHDGANQEASIAGREVRADLDRIVRPAETMRMVGMSRSTIWREEKAGRFPRRVRLSRQAIGWRLSELIAWLENRPQVGGEER